MMSFQGTSPLQPSHVRMYRIGTWVLRCRSRMLMSWLSVAVYSLTGTWTSPKLMAPFQTVCTGGASFFSQRCLFSGDACRMPFLKVYGDAHAVFPFCPK